MAANTSFKVQCPSCEALVSIRDPNLVGKKIDCPKCKYRFVVEDPNAGADEAEERPAKKGAAGKKPAGKAKKKAGGNNVAVDGHSFWRAQKRDNVGNLARIDQFAHDIGHHTLLGFVW